MTFEEMLDQALAMLQRRGRVTYRALKLQFSEPIAVYELRRAGPLRSRLHAAAAVRGLTRFVGRAGELDQLHHALGRASGGHGQVVAVVGEPGVGKSRLIWEVTYSPRVHGWLVLQAGSVSYGKATSYPPVIELLKSYFAIDDRGVFDEGDAHGHEAIRIAEALDHPYSIVWACLGLAYLDSVKGDLSQAALLLERAVALYREWNNALLTPTALASLGHVYAWSGRQEEGVSLLQQANTAHESARSGRFEEGISSLQQGLTAFESAGIGYFHSISVVQLGEAYLLADQVEDARGCADRAVLLARQRGERGYEAWALRLLGEIASHQSRPDVTTAAAHYGASMALADDLGMRPLAAHCHRGLGTLYTKIGRLEQAHAELSTAIELYRAMAMTFWLPQTEAVRAQVEGR
jgi:tetratricopeptide (TPR) repeat protein